MATGTFITGWTTCLTYETRSRLGFDHFDRLLDEMARHGMRRLTVMTASHYHFDPVNHGIAWPVRNPALTAMVDRNAVNADESTEFLSRILAKAGELGIEVVFEVKYAGMEGVREAYPGIETWTLPDGRSPADRANLASPVERERLTVGHVCHDSEISQRFMRDQITDLLDRYPTVDGIAMEWPGYPGEGCHCASTRSRFARDTGGVYETATEGERLDWQNRQVAEVLRGIGELVRADRPGRLFALYTGFSPPDGNIERFQANRGHRIDTLCDVGFDYLMPYCEGRHLEREEIETERVIDYLSPLPAYLHCTIRRKPPGNYPLPPKDPAYIKRVIRWALRYHHDHEQLSGMSFFNETNIPEENRLAVYEVLDETAR